MNKGIGTTPTTTTTQPNLTSTEVWSDTKMTLHHHTPTTATVLVLQLYFVWISSRHHVSPDLISSIK